MNPGNKIPNQTEVLASRIKYFPSVSRWVVLPPVFVQYFWAPYLSSGFILATMFLSVAYQSRSVYKQHRRLGLVQSVWQGAEFGDTVWLLALTPAHGERCNLTRTAEKGLVFGRVFHRTWEPSKFVNRHAVIHWGRGACIFRDGLRKKKKREEHAQCGLLQYSSGHLFGCCFWLPVNSQHWALLVGPLMASDWLQYPIQQSMGSNLPGCWVSAAVLRGWAAGLGFHCCLFWEGARGIVPMSHEPWRDAYRALTAALTRVRLTHGTPDICILVQIQVKYYKNDI